MEKKLITFLIVHSKKWYYPNSRIEVWDLRKKISSDESVLNSPPYLSSFEITKLELELIWYSGKDDKNDTYSGLWIHTIKKYYVISTLAF